MQQKEVIGKAGWGGEGGVGREGEGGGGVHVQDILNAIRDVIYLLSQDAAWFSTSLD